MARKVRCQITGEYGTSDTFYKVNVKGTNKYYKSKEIYDQHNKELRDKENCFEYIAGLVYDGILVPPVFKKIINKLSDKYSYEVIMATVKESESSIDYALNNKNFTNEYGKAKYISKIIENNIYGVSEQHKRIKKAGKKQDREIDLDVMNYAKYNTKKTKDISRFLTEEDNND